MAFDCPDSFLCSSSTPSQSPALRYPLISNTLIISHDVHCLNQRSSHIMETEKVDGLIQCNRDRRQSLGTFGPLDISVHPSESLVIILHYAATNAATILLLPAPMGCTFRSEYPILAGPCLDRPTPYAKGRALMLFRISIRSHEDEGRRDDEGLKERGINDVLSQYLSFSLLPTPNGASISNQFPPPPSTVSTLEAVSPPMPEPGVAIVLLRILMGRDEVNKGDRVMRVKRA
ncbi:hypothetical protein BDQ17DRAFT_1436598 [Cyathus striatus]|nr:hypothetical protein BDQ17DRAFT_1436598 [Cyathus striatus]